MLRCGKWFVYSTGGKRHTAGGGRWIEVKMPFPSSPFEIFTKAELKKNLPNADLFLSPFVWRLLFLSV